MEYVGFPSALMIMDDVWANIWKGSPKAVMDRYAMAYGYTFPAGSAPQSTIIGLLKKYTKRPTSIPAIITPVSPVWTYFLASSILPAP